MKTIHPTGDKFNVWVLYASGQRLQEKKSVNTEEAFGAFQRLTNRLNTSLGMIEQVQITSEDDEYTHAEWQKDKGIVYPTREDIANMRAGG